jgi:ParB family chromosome partitioning protein
MGKLDELMKASRDVAAESMGTPRAMPMHGTSPAPAAPPTPARLQGIARSKAAAEIPVDRIAADPDQPREEFDEEALARLAESLRTRGQLQPIRVRWDESRGLYVIVCGERRWRAARRAGLPALSCVIVEGPVSPAELLAMQMVENLLREDLRPIEQARAFKALMEANGWSTHQLARELAVDQSGVVRALALLRLDTDVQDLVERGDLPPATAYEVSKLDDPGTQRAIVGRIVTEDLSRAEAIAAVREASGRSSRGKAKGRRAKGKPRKVTSRTLRTSTGKVTVENRRGLEPAPLVTALREALDQAEAELRGREEAAA